MIDGSLDGSKVGPLGIKAGDMTDAVWDYIMDASKPYPADCTVPKDKLDILRNEFQYFYPLDLRCSGKDLVSNHLTFFIYNHCAIYPPDKWPKGVRSNGHLLLNNEKMSKSTGNFLTLGDAVKQYGADAMRFALADAGDGLDDANFLEKTADTAILRLFTEKDWIETAVKEIKEGKLRTGPLNWFDKVFMEEMRQLSAFCDSNYTAMLYREVNKNGFYDLQNAKAEYRKAVTGDGLGMSQEDMAAANFAGMHNDVVSKFIEVQTLVMAPIIPHWSEYLWTEVLGHKTSVMNALWPTFKGDANPSILEESRYVRDLVGKIRSTEEAAARKKAKKGTAVAGPVTDKRMTVYVAQDFPQWQKTALSVLKECWDDVKCGRGGEWMGMGCIENQPIFILKNALVLLLTTWFRMKRSGVVKRLPCLLKRDFSRTSV